MTSVVATTTSIMAVAAILVGQSLHNWNRDMKSFESKLHNPVVAKNDDFNVSSIKDCQTWDDLPPVVRSYLHRVLQPKHQSQQEDQSYDIQKPPKVSKMIYSLQFQQHGIFAMGKDNWCPFTARQAFNANPKNLGFVWEAMIWGSKWFTKWIPLAAVCDALVEGKGYLRANLAGFIPIMTDKTFVGHEQELMIGELLRWLAESFLIPTALLPEAGIVVWMDAPDDLKAMNKDKQQAVISMSDQGKKTVNAELLVTFEKDGIEIRGLRPFKEGNSFIDKEWVGRMSNFQLVDDIILIPTEFEVGWVNEDSKEVDLYFKAQNTNHQLIYDVQTS